MGRKFIFLKNIISDHTWPGAGHHWSRDLTNETHSIESGVFELMVNITLTPSFGGVLIKLNSITLFMRNMSHQFLNRTLSRWFFKKFQIFFLHMKEEILIFKKN